MSIKQQLLKMHLLQSMMNIVLLFYTILMQMKYFTLREQIHKNKSVDTEIGRKVVFKSKSIFKVMKIVPAPKKVAKNSSPIINDCIFDSFYQQ